MTEINRTLTVPMQATIVVKWILASAEPSAPTGYTRLSALDMSLGDLGTLWAFKQD